ncbi:MAG: DNA-directed RNA polymerase subunit alpha [Bacteroidetes bacterium CG23_combo_of_CG06-09_8_20_14_all_32_9]|nr:MAG: DNA-directed RNA polymerase subunit alpha [Bacteroidetes bacterium CG23_combo_of_CG06-09_8_20_14_all_32_9]
MAILTFQKPDKVVMLESNETYGKFEFRPLEPGYGLTIGNALRRVLLSSLEGFAINSIKIDGIDHEFSSIKGVVEDVTEIVLNLKQVRFKQQLEDVENETVSVSINGQDTFNAGDINKFLISFKVLNPDLEICHMEHNAKLHLVLNINKGRGYVPAEENLTGENEIGIIPMSSIYTPIKNVKFAIENIRVEQKTDFEKLILEIITDGSIVPIDALKEAAKILIYHFMLFSDEKFTFDFEDKPENEEFSEEMLRMRQLLKNNLLDLDLSVRALNCLKAADVETLADLVVFSRSDLLKFRNFGKKSLTELDELLANLGLSFNMDLLKYKLDKD